MATRQQVCESLRRLEALKRELGIIPKMELIVCNKNKFTKSKFNLRSLNKNEHEGFRFLHLNCTQE